MLRTIDVDTRTSLVTCWAAISNFIISSRREFVKIARCRSRYFHTLFWPPGNCWTCCQQNKWQKQF